tara:strand:- start:52 stop:249 length:198 start_codon:yes stop_codon:yes gene_type:complete
MDKKTSINCNTYTIYTDNSSTTKLLISVRKILEKDIAAKKREQEQIKQNIRNQKLVANLALFFGR